MKRSDMHDKIWSSTIDPCMAYNHELLSNSVRINLYESIKRPIWDGVSGLVLNDGDAGSVYNVTSRTIYQLITEMND